MTGCIWLYLINGGEKSFEEAKVAREELKKIYNCFISKQLVKPEHVVCASGGPGRLFQHDTVTGISKISSLFPTLIPTPQSSHRGRKPQAAQSAWCSPPPNAKVCIYYFA